MIDSFKIVRVLDQICQLKLSDFMKIHDIFHTFLLRSNSNDSLSDQIQSLSLSVIVNEEEDEWELDDILDSRHFGRYKKLQYKVK